MDQSCKRLASKQEGNQYRSFFRNKNPKKMSRRIPLDGTQFLRKDHRGKDITPAKPVESIKTVGVTFLGPSNTAEVGNGEKSLRYIG